MPVLGIMTTSHHHQGHLITTTIPMHMYTLIHIATFITTTISSAAGKVLKNYRNTFIVDKQRRYSVRSDHRRPWKNQHLQKKHRGHIDKHFDSHDKKALKHRHGYKSRSRRHAIISHQTQHNDGMAHHDGNRQHKKHRADVYQQRKSNWARVPKQDHKNIRPANKFTDRKVDNRHRAADKNTDRKMQNKQRHRKREPRRAEFKKNKNRATRNDRGSRKKAKHKRN